MTEQKEKVVKLRDSALEGELLQDLYLVEEKLGRGGTAWVYKGTHQRLLRPIAIKVLFSSLDDDHETQQRFLREARLQYELSHPNIVRVYDSIEDRGITGFVLEWCNGGDLAHWVDKNGGKITARQIEHIFPPVLDALKFAHERGIIHRDLKPQNILLNPTPKGPIPKISDFGIAKVLDEESYTHTGSMLGTLRYIAPEQLKDSKHIDRRADLYSIGAVLYRLATGRHAFPGQAPRLFAQIMQDPAPPPVEAPPPLQKVIMRCLEKSPDARYPDSDALKFALVEAIKEISEDEKNAPHTSPGFYPMGRPDAAKKPAISEEATEHIARDPADDTIATAQSAEDTIAMTPSSKKPLPPHQETRPMDPATTPIKPSQLPTVPVMSAIQNPIQPLDLANKFLPPPEDFPATTPESNAPEESSPASSRQHLLWAGGGLLLLASLLLLLWKFKVFG